MLRLQALVIFYFFLAISKAVIPKNVWTFVPD